MTDQTVTLKARPPWAKHRFPHKRITKKVCVASVPYRCARLGRHPDGHTRVIEAGATYLKVNIRPDNGAHGWKTRRLCIACAVNFELAELTEHDAFEREAGT